MNLIIRIKNHLKFRYLYCIGCLKVRSISFEDYERLLSCRKYFFLATANMLYGHHRIILKKYFNKKFSFITFNRKILSRILIDHGMCFGDTVREQELQNLNFTDYYTYGPKRKVIVERYLEDHVKKSVDVHAVGPYIKYVENFYSDSQLATLKQRYGRTLLVIPSHSVEGINHFFDENLLLQEIERVAVNFDTVLVCVYWKDILEGKHETYLKKNYKVVCAGFNKDPYFLCRLRDLFTLCDLSMSNQLGTHIGYSICLDKPHYFFYQHQTYSGSVQKEQHFVGSNAQKNNEIALFSSLFGICSETITDKQRRIINEYWGK